MSFIYYFGIGKCVFICKIGLFIYYCINLYIKYCGILLQYCNNQLNILYSFCLIFIYVYVFMFVVELDLDYDDLDYQGDEIIFCFSFMFYLDIIIVFSIFILGNFFLVFNFIIYRSFDDVDYGKLKKNYLD